MAKFSIYSSDGQTVRYSGFPTYNGNYMAPAYLEFREIVSPSPIGWQVGDYVDYESDTHCTRTGLRYKLYNIPQPSKQGKKDACGNAFRYNNVQFFAAPKDLELCPFRDLVLGDSMIHFSTMQDVNTYENLQGIVSRIQANLNDWYGSDVWNIVISPNIVSGTELYNTIQEAREFSVSGGTVLDAVNKCYEVWGNIGWGFSVVSGVNTITFGASNVRTSANTTALMQYGQGLGLTSLGKAQSNADEFATRLYAFGSSRNMNFQYYRGNSQIKNAESLDITNLMLPLQYNGADVWGKTDGKYDAHLAFIPGASNRQIALESVYGKRAKYHYFDGSEDDEIYPSLEKMTIGQIRGAMQPTDPYYPNTTIYPTASERVDLPKSVSNPIDDGVYEDGSRMARSVNFPIGEVRKGGAIAAESTDYVEGYEIDLVGETGQYNIAVSGITASITINGIFDTQKQTVVLERGMCIDDGEIEYETIKTINDNGTYDIYVPPYSFIGYAEREPNIRCFIRITNSSPSGYSYGSIGYSYHAPSHTQIVTLSIIFTESFTMTLKQIGFDINYRQALGSNGLATIFVNDGMCAGRSFAVKGCTYQSSTDDWLLTCIRAYDDSTGMCYPNANYQITVNDSFVLLDIAMPDLYIKAAEQRLYERALALYNDISKVKSTYTPELDAIQLATSPSAVVEGMYMHLKDDDLTGGQDTYTIIDSITINEGEAEIPTYKVALREEKSKSFVNRLNQGSTSTPVTSISSSGGEGTGGVQAVNVNGSRYTPADGVVYLPNYPDVSGKADKVASATSGNFAGLDANGNLTDSGKNPSDYLPLSAGASKALTDTLYSKSIVMNVASSSFSALSALLGGNFYQMFVFQQEGAYDPYLVIGGGLAENGCNTYLDGGILRLRCVNGNNKHYEIVNLYGTVMTVNGNALPETTEKYDLGSLVKRWKNLYAKDVNVSNKITLTNSNGNGATIELDANGKIKVDGSMYATGAVTAGGIGSGGGGGGGGDVSSIRIGAGTTPILPDTEGIVTLPSYPDISGKVDKVSGKGLSTNDYTDSAVAEVAKISGIESNISGIESKIPAQATSENQLADKDFVNSSIATNTATFRGTFDLLGENNIYLAVETEALSVRKKVLGELFAGTGGSYFASGFIGTSGDCYWQDYGGGVRLYINNTIVKTFTSNSDTLEIVDNGGVFYGALRYSKYDSVKRLYLTPSDAYNLTDNAGGCDWILHYITWNNSQAFVADQNDYVFVRSKDYEADESYYQRYKWANGQWVYEYSLNNSSFTASQWAAINSGVTSAKVGNYNSHIANTGIHVTAAEKSTWNGKQDTIYDLSTIRSGAAAGATAVQPADLNDYLPLSAGSGKKLTGDLYGNGNANFDGNVTANKIILKNGGWTVTLELDANGNLIVNGNVIATGAITAGQTNN